MTEIISIIPARGGSKELPRKNVLPFLREPLIAHTIRQSLRSQRVNRTFVSTDDEEIASVSIRCGADVIKRPSEISGDAATSEQALHHALDELERRESYTPDLVVFLQCTSPIRGDNDIDDAIDSLMASGADSLLSVCQFHRFIWRIQQGRPTSFNYDYRNRQLRQYLSPEFMENGSIYIFKPWVLLQFDNRLGGKIQLYEMDYFSSFEIDTLDDFMLCEAIMECLDSRTPTARHLSDGETA